MALLEFQDIKKRFAKREILSGISFDVKEGEILGLIGRSGSGKSTLLNTIVGIVRPDKGKILFENKDATKKKDYLRKNVGFATQENLLFDELTIRENSLYFGSLYGIKKREIEARMKELVRLLSLESFEDVQIRNLSGGMTKRANFLVSLIHRPKLLILDEPTVGLDPMLRDVLWAYIKNINETGTTILVSSHLLDELEHNCDRIAVLMKGKIVAVGNIEQYKKYFGKNKSLKEIFRQFTKNENI
jgi:ABC-2 type transport system ATP-binding protein